jgi:hypothetical protein
MGANDKKPVEEVKAQIAAKKTSEKRKLKYLMKIAAAGVLTRMLIYALPFHLGGLIVEILWIPLILLVLALPFYGFERLLDKVKNE